ncbi:MAG TPA: NAD(P)-binding protein [Bryobacteraceae bacterium]|nr:NAD(P)-binding protein [Bryobacteraceae bacterium]
MARRSITRRDFLNGAAMSASSAAWLMALETGDASYPPALTGYRGSTDASSRAAHALRDGDFWKTAGEPTETHETYDLVVVGAGISGLAAAHFYQARAGKSARILILDNHDDFGGHARRNEFRSAGRLLLANGGTWSIESPYPYSRVAGGLMAELGIDPAALETRCVDWKVYNGLKQGTFFDKETFGVERLLVGPLTEAPLSAAARRDIARLETAAVDYLPGLNQTAKKDRLSRVSYKQFLLDLVKVSPEVIPVYQTRPHDLFGVGIDAVSALDCWAMRYPGFQGMHLDREPSPRVDFTPGGDLVKDAPPYFFHFPDGNATIARMLVRRLVPGVAPGRTAEDVVTAKFDYGRLDREGAPVRIRLNSTVVRAKHAGDPAAAKTVAVTYARDRRLFTVHAKAVVMACWNMMIPYLAPELPARQREALRYGVKVPLVYTVVAARNWKAFQKLGVHGVTSPGMYHSEVRLDRPVSIGAYRCPQSPDEPILIRMTRTPCQPGLPERDQHRVGRMDLLTTPFATFESKIRDQLARIVGPGGFDPARDITAITVNRWPHGYAYEYNALWDPDWPAGQRPCEIARQRFGRIAIANSDAAAAAYTDQAIDQGYRAVAELLAL